MWLFNWIKAIGLSRAIKEMDNLEPLFATKIKEAQEKLNQVPPDQFAKTLVDEVQYKLCLAGKIDPLSVLTQEEIDAINGGN